MRKNRGSDDVDDFDDDNDEMIYMNQLYIKKKRMKLLKKIKKNTNKK